MGRKKIELKEFDKEESKRVSDEEVQAAGSVERRRKLLLVKSAKKIRLWEEKS